MPRDKFGGGKRSQCMQHNIQCSVHAPCILVLHVIDEEPVVRWFCVWQLGEGQRRTIAMMCSWDLSRVTFGSGVAGRSVAGHAVL